MQAHDFAEFVARQQNAADDVRVDWIQIREDWFKDLDSLYNQIIDFLAEFVANGSIQYSFIDVTVTEGDIGTYQVRGMNIEIGKKHVFLEPIGTLLIGSRGRVDVIGSAGRAQLLLVNSKAKTTSDLITVKVSVASGSAMPPSPPDEPISWDWKIVVRDPRGRFLELDRESFFELLMEVAGE